SGSGSGPGPVPPAVGVGTPAVKSAALSAVWACSLRATDVALVVPGAGAVPAYAFALDPHPTRSTTSSAAAQAVPEQVRRSVDRTRAIFAPDPDIATVPVRSGVGRAGLVVSAPNAWPTRNDPPGTTCPER